MTAVASFARQPFGALDGSRIRNLSNVKNVQNGMMLNISYFLARSWSTLESLGIFAYTGSAILPSKSSLKRSHEPSQYDSFDSENMDPGIFCSPTKKNKTQDFVQPFKASKLKLNTISRPINAMKSRAQTPAAPGSLKRKSTDTITPEDGGSLSKVRHVEPAPVPSGRSPNSKRIGIGSRHRMSSTPFTRVNPPSFSGRGRHDLPFSIDAALSGTVSSYKKKSDRHGVRNGWKFDVHEDTKDQEMEILLQHSTGILDISDDEGGINAKDGRGKENIPPADAVPVSAPIATTVPVSRKNLMTDEPRTPLGDLDASEFYAQGCDANSAIEIEEEDSEEPDTGKDVAVSELEKASVPSTGANTSYKLDDGWKMLLAQVEVATKSNAATAESFYTAIGDGLNRSSEIEIWESESAKGEDDAQTEEFSESTFAPTLGEELLCQV